MTDAWDGRPENPERDGWHWLTEISTGDPVAAFWNRENKQNWSDLWDFHGTDEPWHKDDVGRAYFYIGPCLTPAEVASRIAEARAQEREACATAVADTWTKCRADGMTPMPADYLAAIRARKDSTP